MNSTSTSLRLRTGAVLLALAVVAVAAATSAAPAGAGPEPGYRAIGAPCRRDQAADLRWIRWLSRTFEGKEPSKAAVDAWARSFTDGVPYADIATYLANGPGASRRTVRAAFATLLHRNPTPAELTSWSAWVVPNGAAALAAQLGAQPEAVNRAGGTLDRWLDQLYLDVLQRPIDPGARTYWLDRLNRGTTRSTVVANLWNSSPRVRLRLDAIYQLLFARPVDSGAVGFWGPKLLALGDAGVAGAVASTPTAWNLAQRTYGGATGPMPPACPPPPPSWIPPAGSIVTNLSALSARGPRLVAMTFDDGPTPEWTPQVLAVLKREQVPATFFVVGYEAKARPDLIRAILDQGHHVGTHSMTHPNLVRMSAAQQRQQIVESADLIDRIAGRRSTVCFRPPYGNHNATTDRIARDRGLATILWSRDGMDWKRPGVDTIVRGNLDTRYDHGRGVIILHDGGGNRSQTVAALPRLLQALKAQGYQFVQIC